jgi:hypothetical protein
MTERPEMKRGFVLHPQTQGSLGLGSAAQSINDSSWTEEYATKFSSPKEVLDRTLEAFQSSSELTAESGSIIKECCAAAMCMESKNLLRHYILNPESECKMVAQVWNVALARVAAELTPRLAKFEAAKDKAEVSQKLKLSASILETVAAGVERGFRSTAAALRQMRVQLEELSVLVERGSQGVLLSEADSKKRQAIALSLRNFFDNILLQTKVVSRQRR